MIVSGGIVEEYQTCYSLYNVMKIVNWTTGLSVIVEAQVLASMNISEFFGKNLHQVIIY